MVMKSFMVDPLDPLESHRIVQQALAGGVEVRRGDRVRLRPRGGAGVSDVALAGRVATIAVIEQDYEDRIHIAVTIDDDPRSRDLGEMGTIAHRFYFDIDEIEPMLRDVDDAALAPAAMDPGADAGDSSTATSMR
jgi:hypothetical protein